MPSLDASTSCQRQSTPCLPQRDPERNYVPLAATALDAAATASLATIPDGQSKQDGIAVGADAAAALIALRSTDGSSPARFFQPASADPGVWQPTPGCPPAGGILFHWQNVTTFGIQSNAQFRSAPPPALSSAEYARDYNEARPRS